MVRRTALIVVCLLAASLAPLVPAQTVSEDQLRLSVQATAADGSLSTSLVPTFHPDETIRFTFTVTNTGDQSVTLSRDDARVDLQVDDAFGGTTLTDASDPGGSVEIPAGQQRTVGNVTWDPADHFAGWSSTHETVVSHLTASASLRVGDVNASQPLVVEERGLAVDAYDEPLSFVVPYFPTGDTAVPVNVQLDRDDPITGDLSFVVRDADGVVYSSGVVDHVTLNTTHPVASTSWGMTADDGVVVDGGTYLVQAQVETDDGTRHRDAFPIEVRSASEVLTHPIVATDRPFYRAGDTVQINVTVRNPTDQARRLEFPTAQQVDAVVTRPNGSTWRWSDGKVFTQAETSRIVEADSAVTWTLNFTLAEDAESGSYRVEGVVTTHEPRESLPTAFHVGFEHQEPTCTGGETTDLSISLTDVDRNGRSTFAPGETVVVNLVNEADQVYDRGARVEVVDAAGETVFHKELARGVAIHPGSAHTIDWDQTLPDGRQAPNGSYRVTVTTPGGQVGFGFEIGDPSGSSGSSTGRIQGTSCSFDVPGYLDAISVRPDRPRYAPGDNVTVRYRAHRQIEGEVTLTVLTPSRDVVQQRTTVHEEPLPGGESDRFVWRQRDADGDPVDEGFYILRVTAGSRAGEAPVLIGDPGPGPLPTAGETVRIEPRSPHHQDWSDERLERSAEVYGRHYAELLQRGRADGGFTTDGDLVQGRYVSFSFDPAGRISGYSIAPTGRDQSTVFSSVAVRPYDAASGSSRAGLSLPNPIVVGPNFVHRADLGMTHAVDSPRGPLMFRAAEDKTVDFTLADGYSATVRDGDENCVDVSGNRSVGICIHGGGSIQVVDSVARAEMSAGSQLMVVNFPSDPTGQTITRGITDGAVGAEVVVGANGSSARQVRYGPGLGIDSRSLPGGVELVVDRDVEAGTCVLVEVPSERLETSRLEEIQVSLDGEELPRATNLQALLDRCGQADGGSYVGIAGEDPQLLISVPHFSERTITVQNVAEVVQSPEFQLAVAQAFLVATVVTLAAGVAVFRQKG